MTSIRGLKSESTLKRSETGALQGRLGWLLDFFAIAALIATVALLSSTIQ